MNRNSATLDHFGLSVVTYRSSSRFLKAPITQFRSPKTLISIFSLSEPSDTIRRFSDPRLCYPILRFGSRGLVCVSCEIQSC
ncbi:unnamed protein product [Rhodiola kirilowii]